MSDKLQEADKGTQVPLQAFSKAIVENFILFESTDALQDSNPFSENNLKLYNQIAAFERDFRLESMLLHVDDEARRQELKNKLSAVYDTTLPYEKERREALARLAEAATLKKLPEIEQIRFQSLADFYLKGILPLYNQAFEFEWVRNSNIDLNNELQNPAYAQEGFLPIGPAQFNAAYQVLVMWLSRIYEIRGWSADQQERYAIEMLASWPLMSLAIRPFLELASFFPVNLKDLYRLEQESLPMLPLHAQQLLQLYLSEERGEDINEQMDLLALKVLTDVADWARQALPDLAHLEVPEHQKEMIRTRLRGLSTLHEFEKQFPFREHGGYSDRLPDLTYIQQAEAPDKFSEDPAALENVFKDTLVLKLRFSGFGLVQLSTDPDPPLDEVGCSGTHMFHAANGDKKFNRALVWQIDRPGKYIERGPAQVLSPIGVNLVDVSLQITNPAASAGYVPVQSMQSTGAVQTNGIQQVMEISGLEEVLTLPVGQLPGDGGTVRLNLLEKGGEVPRLFGDNHLVWKDGEPIDPFVFAITDRNGNLIVQREVYNEGLPMSEMSPLQRIYSARSPVGFGSYRDIPAWAFGNFPGWFTEQLKSATYPGSYLQQRAVALAQYLQSELSGNPSVTQQKVDEIISAAERLYQLSFPKGTTVGWLGAVLNYGHTISGKQREGAGQNALFEGFKGALNLVLDWPAGTTARDQANARWLMRYAKGVMDTDALSDVVYGELYVPVVLKPSGQKIRFQKSWSFPKELAGVIGPFALQFDKPFWSDQYTVHDKERSFPWQGTTIRESLLEAQSTGYRYAVDGFTGVGDFTAQLSVMVMLLRKEGYFRSFLVDANVVPSTVNPRVDATNGAGLEAGLGN